MEERKLTVDIQKKDLSQNVQKLDNDEATRIQFDKSNNKIVSDGPNENWFELRFQNMGPDRRGYHASFVHNKRLYIYGGHDIREGSKDSLWMLDLRKLKDFELDSSLQNKDCQWKEIQTKGDDKPGCLAHHTCVVFGERMYLFGGSNLETENRKFYSLDMNHFRWEVVKSRGDLPITRDEHTCVVYENESSMIIFGGFCNGERTNELIKYIFPENRWAKITISPGSIQPQARSGHSACIFENSMYIFGGKDSDNDKLNDLWKLDLTTYQWEQIKVSDGFKPQERSGHSCDVFDNYMIIFGGIYEITKELNDLHLFDFKKNRWVTMFEETHSPKKGDNTFNQDDTSPFQDRSISPKKSNISPNNRRQGSPPKTSKMGSKTMSPSKTSIKKTLNLNTSNTTFNSRNGKGLHQVQTAIQLTTPTSISMMNSFIIKNADQSFDHYFTGMKKRKLQQQSTLGASFNNQSTLINQTLNAHNESVAYGKNKGKRPAARDGHTGMTFGKYLIIFGGDRHHMPFNDTFMLDVKMATTAAAYKMKSDVTKNVKGAFKEGNQFVFFCFVVCNFFIFLASFGVIGCAIYLFVVTKEANTFNICFLLTGVSLFFLSLASFKLRKSVHLLCMYLFVIAGVFMFQLIITIVMMVQRQALVDLCKTYFSTSEKSLDEIAKFEEQMNASFLSVSIAMLIFTLILVTINTISYIIIVQLLTVLFGWCYRDSTKGRTTKLKDQLKKEQNDQKMQEEREKLMVENQQKRDYYAQKYPEMNKINEQKNEKKK